MNGPTEKQLILLKSLVADRQDKISQMPPTWILRLKAAIQGELTGKETSTVIDFFVKKVPADVIREMPQPGFYRLDGNIYEVRLTQDGSRTYAMQRTQGEVVLVRAAYVLGAIHAIARKPDRLTDDEAKPFAPKPRTKPRPRIRVNA